MARVLRGQSTSLHVGDGSYHMMATASVWKEGEIKEKLPCQEFAEFKVKFKLVV